MKTNEHERHVSVSAFYQSDERVTETLAKLSDLAIPRDLIEVVVSPEGRSRFRHVRPHSLGTRSLAFAGLGAVLGFLLTSAMSLLIVLWPGAVEPGIVAWVQLLGPNVGVAIGALGGAIIGVFVHKRPHDQYGRVAGRDDILLLVHDRAPQEVAAVSKLLEDTGGYEVMPSQS